MRILSLFTCGSSGSAAEAPETQLLSRNGRSIRADNVRKVVQYLLTEEGTASMKETMKVHEMSKSASAKYRMLEEAYFRFPGKVGKIVVECLAKTGVSPNTPPELRFIAAQHERAERRLTEVGVAAMLLFDPASFVHVLDKLSRSPVKAEVDDAKRLAGIFVRLMADDKDSALRAAADKAIDKLPSKLHRLVKMSADSWGKQWVQHRLALKLLLLEGTVPQPGAERRVVEGVNRENETPPITITRHLSIERSQPVSHRDTGDERVAIERADRENKRCGITIERNRKLPIRRSERQPHEPRPEPDNGRSGPVSSAPTAFDRVTTENELRFIGKWASHIGDVGVLGRVPFRGKGDSPALDAMLKACLEAGRDDKDQLRALTIQDEKGICATLLLLQRKVSIVEVRGDEDGPQTADEAKRLDALRQYLARFRHAGLKFHDVTVDRIRLDLPEMSRPTRQDYLAPWIALTVRAKKIRIHSPDKSLMELSEGNKLRGARPHTLAEYRERAQSRDPSTRYTLNYEQLEELERENFERGLGSCRHPSDLVTELEEAHRQMDVTVQRKEHDKFLKVLASKALLLEMEVARRRRRRRRQAQLPSDRLGDRQRQQLQQAAPLPAVPIPLSVAPKERPWSVRGKQSQRVKRRERGELEHSGAPDIRPGKQKPLRKEVPTLRPTTTSLSIEPDPFAPPSAPRGLKPKLLG